MDTIRIGNIFPELTVRERKICAMSVSGMTAKEVAMSLGLSHRTVEDHRESIYKKTKIKNMISVAYKVFGEPQVVS